MPSGFGKKKKTPRNENYTKIKNLMEKFSNRLDPAEDGISELKSRSTEIIQNAYRDKQKKNESGLKTWGIE